LSRFQVLFVKILNHHIPALQAPVLTLSRPHTRRAWSRVVVKGFIILDWSDLKLEKPLVLSSGYLGLVVFFLDKVSQPALNKTQKPANTATCTVRPVDRLVSDLIA
jgi:hypothetical protein